MISNSDFEKAWFLYKTEYEPNGISNSEEGYKLPGPGKSGGEAGGSMLSINGLHNFYYLPHFFDMRCKARRISEIILLLLVHNKISRILTKSKNGGLLRMPALKRVLYTFGCLRFI